MRMGIVADVAQLPVEVVLQEEPVADRLFVGSDESVDARLVDSCVFAPLREIRRREAVAQDTVNGIRFQPYGILFEKVVERLRGEYRRALLGIDDAQVFVFQGIDPFVIDCRQGIEFAAQGFKPFAHLRVFGLPDLVKGEVVGVQGVNRVGFVGVGLAPRAAAGGVVYRQNLDNALTGGDSPIDQQFQVRKFAGAEALLGAQGKYRNGGSRAVPAYGIYKGGDLYGQRLVGVAEVVETAVFALFPSEQLSCLSRDNDEFVFKIFGQCRGIETDAPFGESGIVQIARAGGVPVAQGGAAADDAQPLRRRYGRCADTYFEFAGNRFCRCAAASGGVACKNHVGESRRPEYTVGLSGRLGYDMMFHLFFCKCTINFFSELSFV